MDYQNILYTKDGPVVTLTLNRPDALNAISPALEQELHAALDEADADSEVRAFLDKRDAPFRPEPFGPKSKKD